MSREASLRPEDGLNELSRKYKVVLQKSYTEEVGWRAQHSRSCAAVLFCTAKTRGHQSLP